MKKMPSVTQPDYFTFTELYGYCLTIHVTVLPSMSLSPSFFGALFLYILLFIYLFILPFFVLFVGYA